MLYFFNMQHIEGSFKGQGSLSLYYQGWLPDSQVKALLIIAHGIAEHCGRYGPTASHFASRGFAVYSFDYRGHGRSEGQKGYVERFTYFQDDLATFQRMVARIHSGQKTFILGHSMGAAVGLDYALHHQPELAGLILSGAPFRSQPYFPAALIAALRPLAVMTPHAGLYRLNSSTLSRDKTIITSYDTDPLVYRGKLSARLALEFLWRLHTLEKELPRIKIPALILHGGADNLCSPEGSQIVSDKISSKDKALHLYQGFYHEILNEPERSQVWEHIEDWLNQRS